jgi:hypothetical protein
MAETDEQPKVWLVVHCRRCHGWLMSPDSVAQRIGPTCAAANAPSFAPKPRRN